MERRQKVFDYLDRTGIPYEYYEHPEAPTIEIARQYWRNDGSKHCKNLFFRNHKGNRHYLVVFDCDRQLAIHDLEHISGRANSRSRPSSAWNAISDYAPVRYHLSG